jgi:DNA-binding Lrp family transcriptional regulator
MYKARKSKGLGERHQRILAFLQEYQSENKYPPSIREIGESTGITSTSVVNYYLDQLEKKGLIERERKAPGDFRIPSPDTKVQKVKISPKVFISYAREDLAVAKQIYMFLRRNGLTPWLDKLSLLPGQDWELEIQNEIETSDYVIICLSKKSVAKRGYIQKEFRKALSVLETIPEVDIYIVPIRLEECEVPPAFVSKHWMDWFESEAQIKLLEVFEHPNISSRFSRKASMLEARGASRLCFSCTEQR